MSTHRIAFQGEIGAYSEQAALQYFGENITLLPVPTFKALFATIENGTADAAVVPIENSLAGSVYENYDLLLAHQLPIVGETILSISHHLLALPGVKKTDIRSPERQQTPADRFDGDLCRRKYGKNTPEHRRLGKWRPSGRHSGFFAK